MPGAVLGSVLDVHVGVCLCASSSTQGQAPPATASPRL